MKRSSPSAAEEQSRLNPEKRSRIQVNVITDSEVTIDDHSAILENVETVIDDSEMHQVIQIQDTSGNIVTEEILGIEGTSSEDDSSVGIIAQHMDITEPLSTLKTLLEQRLGVSLEDFRFYLQDTQELDASKNLVDQCVQGEGLIQVNVEIVERGGIKKINIVDVLKPAEEVVAMSPEMVQQVSSSEMIGEPPVVRKVVIPVPEESERLTRWMVSPEFKAIQEKLKIPLDPLRWNPEHVRHWIQWATQHFGLPNISLSDWKMTGKELCDMGHPEFVKKVPFDPDDLFWTHLELLRKCKIVAVIQQPALVQQVPQLYTNNVAAKNAVIKNRPRIPKIGSPRVAYEGCPGNRTGNNGQIQLWQFLLELLTDKDHREYIQWIGEDGEFRLNNPEMVAQLWGQRKNKPSMNYEKLSRALRYYYDGDMISKVHGKRFVYKFVCDLKSLVGYDAAELNRLVMECEQKKIERLQAGVMTMSTLALSSGSSQNC